MQLCILEYCKSRALRNIVNFATRTFLRSTHTIFFFYSPMDVCDCSRAPLMRVKRFSYLHLSQIQRISFEMEKETKQEKRTCMLTRNYFQHMPIPLSIHSYINWGLEQIVRVRWAFTETAHWIWMSHLDQKSCILTSTSVQSVQMCAQIANWCRRSDVVESVWFLVFIEIAKKKKLSELYFSLGQMVYGQQVSGKWIGLIFSWFSGL